MSNFAIKIENLSKCYRIYNKPQDRLKQALWRGKKQFFREFWALRNISFRVAPGEAIGIIGRNGAGKSTLLQLLCKTQTPTSGTIEVNGRVAALLELGAGFNPEFTGRENVYMNGAILGFTNNEMEARFEEIAAFADIGEFIEQPVKTYSSGMFVRLAFAVQACVEPEILIVDEALSVGDIFFQQKCHARMAELLKRGTSILLVSHDMLAIEKYCSEVVLLHEGECVFVGQSNVGVEQYYQLEQWKKKKNAIPSLPNADNTESRNDRKDSLLENCINPQQGVPMPVKMISHFPDWPPQHIFTPLTEAIYIGDLEKARCIGVAVCNHLGIPTTQFEMGEVAYFYYEFELLQEIEIPIGGVLLTDRMNINIHGKNSIQYLLTAPSHTPIGTRIRFRQTMELGIAPGEYAFQVALATMLAQDYAKITQMEHIELTDKIETILRVRQAGTLIISEKKQGIKLPFHGYVDLKGEFSVALSSFDGNLK